MEETQNQSLLENEFVSIVEEMVALYSVKNKNYGNSYDMSLDKHGLIAGIVRMEDKLNRLSTLVKNKSEGTKEESIQDTLIDLANYAVMTLSYLRRKNKNNG